MSNTLENKQPIDLSIIILNHNTRGLTEQAVDSINDTGSELSYEIIIVDNSSSEAEVFKCPVNPSYPNIRSITIENKGFSNGCNIGASLALGSHLLFLNSDVIIHPFTLEKSMAYLKAHNDIGALGIKSLLRDGSLDHGCRRGFPTPMNSLYYFIGLDRKHPENPKYNGYQLNHLDENKTSEVDAVSGSFMMMKKSVFDQVEGFDEDFFMYGEDLDICYRIKEKGYKVIYYPEVTMLHLKGQSGLSTYNELVNYHFYNSMIIFYDKHYKRKYGLVMMLLVHAAVRIKYLLNRKRKD